MNNHVLFAIICGFASGNIIHKVNPDSIVINVILFSLSLLGLGGVKWLYKSIFKK